MEERGKERQGRPNAVLLLDDLYLCHSFSGFFHAYHPSLIVFLGTRVSTCHTLLFLDILCPPVFKGLLFAHIDAQFLQDLGTQLSVFWSRSGTGGNGCVFNNMVNREIQMLCNDTRHVIFSKSRSWRSIVQNGREWLLQVWVAKCQLC